MKKILKNIKEIQFCYRFAGRAQLNSLYWVDNQKICGLKSLLKLNMCLLFPIPYEDQILLWKNDYIWNIFKLLLSTVRTLQKHVHGTIKNRYQKIKFWWFERWMYHTQSNPGRPKKRKIYYCIWKTWISNLDMDFSIFQAQLSHGHDLIKIPFSLIGMIILVIFLSYNIN